MVIFATLMNRIDRLNALRILLESRRLITAQEIADHFGLSLRTVYRDIRSLQEAGIEVEGEAGLGYRLSRQAHLRPVSFQSVEALSLLLAAKVVERHLDAHHTAVFDNAIRKIRAALAFPAMECSIPKPCTLYSTPCSRVACCKSITTPMPARLPHYAK